MKDKCLLTDQELIEAVHAKVKELCDTGGKSWSLQVPVNFHKDPDMLFIELSKRLEARNKEVEQLKQQDTVENGITELRQAAEPLIKYLAERHNPHVTAIITGSSVEVLGGINVYSQYHRFHCRLAHTS